MTTVMFVKLIKYGHENPGGAQELKTGEVLIQSVVFEVVPRALRWTIGKF